MLVLGVLGFEEEILMVEDDLTVHVLNKDPESLRRPVNLNRKTKVSQEYRKKRVQCVLWADHFFQGLRVQSTYWDQYPDFAPPRVQQYWKNCLISIPL